MPSDGIDNKLSHSEILRVEEIVEIARAASELGIKKFRITGGEPLVRKGILEIISGIREAAPESEIGMTTNGILLKETAEDLKAAGLNRVNISFDTMKEDKFKALSRSEHSPIEVLEAIDFASKVGLTPIKINTVLLKGINDDEVSDFVQLTMHHDLHVRFIELMPVGEGIKLFKSHYMPNEEGLKNLGLISTGTYDGVAMIYKLPGSKGTVGSINPISNHFCSECNKIRLTSDGKIIPCLHDSTEIDVRGLVGEALKKAIEGAVYLKPMKHTIEADEASRANRAMNGIGG
jgi:cyclic pyranopterin phosphate synthase